MECMHRRMCHHLFLCAIVEMVWKTRHVRMMRGIVPSFDQATCAVLPMMAILCHNNFSRLYFNTLGQFQKTVIAQRQTVAYETYSACGVFFLPELLHTFNVWAGQGCQKEPLKISADLAHRSFSSSRRSVSTFR